MASPAPPLPPLEELPAASGAFIGLFVGIGITMVFNIVFSLIYTSMDTAALNSDKAVQTEGSLTRTSTVDDGYGGVAYYCFHYEFHVPPARSSSSFQKMLPAGNLGPCGASCTGKVHQVSLEKYNAHGSNLPKDCVVRYVAADPRRSAIHSIGEDTSPTGSSKHQFMKMLFPIIFVCVWLGVSVSFPINMMTNTSGTGQVWGSAAMTGFFIVVGLCGFTAVCTTIRARMRLPAVPGCKDSRTKDCVLTKLTTPYQKPIPAPVAMPMAPPGGMEMMAVTCPDGVEPGATIQIATPSGAPMAVVVPAGVKPGQPFQVALPAAPVAVVAAAVVPAAAVAVVDASPV